MWGVNWIRRPKVTEPIWYISAAQKMATQSFYRPFGIVWNKLDQLHMYPIYSLMLQIMNKTFPETPCRQPLDCTYSLVNTKLHLIKQTGWLYTHSHMKHTPLYWDVWMWQQNAQLFVHLKDLWGPQWTERPYWFSLFSCCDSGITHFLIHF